MYQLYDLVNDLNNMFKEAESYRSFPVDVCEEEGGFKVVCEMPGIKKENINISFDDGELTISAKCLNTANDSKYLLRERHNMDLKRTLSFGDIKEDNMSAKLEDGILTINITTKAPEKKEPKAILIE